MKELIFHVRVVAVDEASPSDLNVSMKRALYEFADVEDVTVALADSVALPKLHYACPSHCCPVHGCKYGHADCPVVTGTTQPTYPDNNGCERCEDEPNPDSTKYALLLIDEERSDLSEVASHFLLTTNWVTTQDQSTAYVREVQRQRALAHRIQEAAKP